MANLTPPTSGHCGVIDHTNQPLMNDSALSANSSNHTFVMPNSPLKLRKTSKENRPQIHRTLGNRPACLVNASVTYCGEQTIYAFGGFDQHTDEVYNHVLRLDINTYTWTLMPNYGDIPGVRMGHTATLYDDHQLVVFGGENEAGRHLSELYILNLKTLHWTCPRTSGPLPRGRGRHAATIWKDHLFITGGVSKDQEHIGDCCILNLKSMVWLRPFAFVERFDHVSWVWGSKLWLFGGLNEKMERVGDISWIELEDIQRPSTEKQRTARTASSDHTARHPVDHRSGSHRGNQRSPQDGSARVRTGSISNVQFMSGSNIPSQIFGTHHHVVSGSSLLDFAIPPRTTPKVESGLMCLDLEELRWSRLAPRSELFEAPYQWHYCVTNHEGNRAWLLGCPFQGEDLTEETLSDVMEVDLRKFGILGEQTINRSRGMSGHFSGTHLSFLGHDLASIFEETHISGSGTDFVITGDDDEEAEHPATTLTLESFEASTRSGSPSPMLPVPHAMHVHRIILQARWPHFRRLYNAQMAEYHSKKLHVPEPRRVVRAFLFYLYTDSVAHHPVYCSDVATVAGLLVMANVYDMQELNIKCVHRLSKELDIDNAAIIWERAGTAGEDWLRGRAAAFILSNWGHVVRTDGFRSLSQTAIVELCEEAESESRVTRQIDLEDSENQGGDKFENTFTTGPMLPGPEHAVTAEDTEVTEDEDHEMA